jgi:hypothetical protein
MHQKAQIKSSIFLEPVEMGVPSKRMSAADSSLDCTAVWPLCSENKHIYTKNTHSLTFRRVFKYLSEVETCNSVEKCLVCVVGVGRRRPCLV